MESINTPKQITNQFEDLLASQLSEFERKRAMRIIIDYEDKSDRDALIKEKQEFYDQIEQKNKNKENSIINIEVLQIQSNDFNNEEKKFKVAQAKI